MTVTLIISEHIAVVTIDRPQQLNALDPETHAGLRASFVRIREDSSVRAVVLTGTGQKAFSTGSDLKKTMPPPESFAQLTFGKSGDYYAFSYVDAIDQPVICAINGYALAGGLELAMACDIRIASDTSRFAQTEVRVGSIPAAGGTQRLPRSIGPSNAMLLMLTGDQIDAAEALSMGLISKVVPADALMPTAMAIAERIASSAPLAVRSIKRLVRDAMDSPLEAGIRAEQYVFGTLRDTRDRIEGRVAFQEKRAPRYTGA